MSFVRYSFLPGLLKDRTFVICIYVYPFDYIVVWPRKTTVLIQKLLIKDQTFWTYTVAKMGAIKDFRRLMCVKGKKVINITMQINSDDKKVKWKTEIATTLISLFKSLWEFVPGI